uniref:Uncharacterized protein n=1 Tax=Meloidogyne floridensis TaxID=298350 RepID=A0A915NWE0_9BILA
MPIVGIFINDNDFDDLIVLDEIKYFLYEKLITLEIESKESKETELRLVVPLLYWKLDSKILRVASMVDNFGKLKEKVDNLNVNLWSSKKVYTSYGACLILSFIKVINYVLKFNNRTATSKEKANLKAAKEALTNWDGKECKKETNIEKAFKQQRDILRVKHTKFIENNVEKFSSKIINNPGTLTKMLQFIQKDKLDFLKLENLIFDNEFVKKYFINALKTEFGLKSVLANIIALKTILWARWMNKLLISKETSDFGLSRNILNEIWKKQQAFFIRKIDENFIELTEFALDQLDLIIAVDASSSDKMKKVWEDLESGKIQKIEKNSEKYEQYINWINGKLLQNNNLAKLYFLKIVGYNGIKEIFAKFELAIKYEDFGINEEKLEELIEIEINDYIDPNERRKIEKDKVKSEETLSEISEESNYENKELKGSEHGSDVKKQRKSKKQVKREKRLKNEINKGKYTLDFMENIKDSKDDKIYEIILKEKVKKSPFEVFLIKLKGKIIECQNLDNIEIKLKEIEKNLNLAENLISVENNEERRWFNGRKLIWEDEKEKILEINEIDCELLEKRLTEFLEKNIQEEMNKKLIPNSHRDNEQTKNIAKFVMSGSHRLRTAT